MNEIVTIQNTELPVVEFGGERVITLAMMDAVHQRPEGTAGRNFREHRDRLILGEDFFELTADEIRRQSLTDAFPPRTAKGIILAESGYLMLVKSFTDELAWEVQRSLVNGYFKTKTIKTGSHAVPRQPKPQSALDAMRRMKAAEIGMSLAERLVTKFANLGEAARQVITAKLVNSAMGEEVVPLPTLEYRTYSALEVGEKLNITANAVGRLANKHGLKIEQYGRYVLDKSQHSDKQVEAFRYNDAAVERMRDLLRDGGAIAPVKA